MSTAAIERYTLRNASTFGAPMALAALAASLFVRLVPDVSGKPLHEDEAVAGLIAARPAGDVLHTVVLDRGGAPLHFLLAHVALAFDSSPQALRWLSVVFAVATVTLCYDLARRLAGRLAGLTAAALTASSQLLTVYGTFGRMYSLFAFASALAAVLFVRALERPARTTALAAGAASLLPLAVHPFGAFLLGAEAGVALWLWRGRDLRAALPVIGVSLLALPLLFANVRLSDRYGPEVGQKLDGGTSPGEAGLRALGGAAGGWSALLGVFVVLASVGVLTLGRRRPAVAAFACLTVAVPPIVLAVAGAAGAVSDRLGPRHLIFMLPLWITLVATGASRLAGMLPAKARIAALVAVIGAAALAPAAVSDPRTTATGEREAVAAPAAWLRARLNAGDVLYPYSPVFLAALPRAASAHGWSREPVALERGAHRTTNIDTVFVSLPLNAPIDARRLHPEGLDVHVFTSWLILERRGPFADGAAALRATARMLLEALPVVADAAPGTRAYLEQLRGAACDALLRLRTPC